jgi:hypothetical protein
LANAHRHIEQLIADSPKKFLLDLFPENSPLVTGAGLTGAASPDVPPLGSEWSHLVSDDLSFRIKLPNPMLRHYLAYKLGRINQRFTYL